MTEIKIFENAEMGVQVRTVMNENNEPLFCLADVCKVLELQPSRVKDRLKENGVTSSNVIDSMGRKQLATFVNESNLYRVIMRSDKPQAEAFQDWVCEEVLPSLRKNDKPTDAQQVTISNTPANCIFNLGDVDIKDRDGEFWFCAKDVANAIGYDAEHIKNWDRWLEPEDKLTTQNERSGQNRNMTYISESALYRVLIKTDVPKAKPFERWVTKTVLPSLRKNGEYKMPSTDSEKFQMEKEMMVVDFTAKLLNMNDDGKIKMMRKVCEMHSLPGTLLPTYTPKTEETQCLANLLDGRMSSRAFNNMLLSLGYVRKVENQGKPFYNITEKGLPYGENMKNAYSPNDKTVCRWYASKFEELYSRVFEEMKQKSLFRQ